MGTVTCNLSGRYVYIKQNNNDYLTLCEVAVWGQAPAPSGSLPISRYVEELAIEPCSDQSIVAHVDQDNEAKIFEGKGCVAGTDEVVNKLDRYETPLMRHEQVGSILLPPGKAIEVRGKPTFALETVWESHMKSIAKWEVQGDVRVMNGEIVGRGKTSLITSSGTGFVAPLSVEVTMKQMSDVRMSEITGLEELVV